MSRRVTSHVAALALIAALVGALWIHRVYIDPPPASGIGSSDLNRYFYPLAAYMQRELRSGELPIWNPYQLAGMPFLALHMPALLYPPNPPLMALLPPARVLEAQTVLHLVVAGFGMWLFTRRLGLGQAAASAGTLAFVLAGQSLHWIYNPSYLATLAWLPVLLWVTDGLIREGRPRQGVGLAVVLALAFLGGWSQGFLFEVELASAYALVGLAVWTPRTARSRTLGVGLAGGLLFAGLVAFQLIPTLELATGSARSLAGLSLEDAAWGSIGPECLLRGLTGVLPVDSQRDPFWPMWRQDSAAILTLPLIMLGMADRRRRAHWLFFLAAALLAGAYMLGGHTPVFSLFYRLPLGDVYRFPARMGFVYAFSLAVLVAIGVQGCQRLLSARFGEHAAAVGGAILALAVGGDLYARSALPFPLPVQLPSKPYAPRELVELLELAPGQERLFVVGGITVRQKLGMMYGIPVVPDYEPLVPARYQHYFTGRDPSGTWAGQVGLPAGPLAPFATPTLGRLLDLMSVRYLAWEPDSWRARPAASAIAQLTTGAPIELGPVRVAERSSALPRAYVVHTAITEPDPERARTLLIGGTIDVLGAVVVDRAPPALDPLRAGAREEASISSYTPTEVTVAVSCASACLLVLTDLDHSGWTARVGGAETEIYRVNLLFRGVHLTPGTHEVVYRYAPASLRVGAAISLTTLAVLATVPLALRYRR